MNGDSPVTLAGGSARNPVPIPIRLEGGVVAHNEGSRIEGALRSLLGQELPSGVQWGDVWVVASGCSDDTVEVVERVARDDGRVRLIVELDRGGKARAIQRIFGHARGDALALLNADANAEPGSIASLLRAAPWPNAPWAVMARPVFSLDRESTWTGAVRTMWDLHHRFHCLLQEDGGLGHLSDELLLLSLPSHPPLPDGIINDGSYLAVWLAQHGGSRRYATDSWVSIQIPRSLRDHLIQRRRILVGNDQVAAVLGAPPSTLSRYALRNPRGALSLIRRTIASVPDGKRNFLKLAGAEVIAKMLALWDRLPPRRNHVLWKRISPERDAPPAEVTSSVYPPTPRDGTGVRPSNSAAPLAERRVASILDVARQFSTGLRLEELASLLPEPGPKTSEEIGAWLSTRNDLARLEGGWAFHPMARAARVEERRDRGYRFQKEAQELVDRYLSPVLRWVRCVGLSGSAAYGEPKDGDDLDFFVVTRTGALWCFLAYAYLAVRLRLRSSVLDACPPPCFNYALTDARAPQEFQDAHGFLFAREALSVKPLHGMSYYGGLLASAPWIRKELPRLNPQLTDRADPTDPLRAPLSVRLANAALYPIIAPYLQLVGLRRNAAARRDGRPEALFRTVTGWNHLAFQSERFDQLRDRYGSATSTPEAGQRQPTTEAWSLAE